MTLHMDSQHIKLALIQLFLTLTYTTVLGVTKLSIYQWPSLLLCLKPATPTSGGVFLINGLKWALLHVHQIKPLAPSLPALACVIIVPGSEWLNPILANWHILQWTPQLMRKYVVDDRLKKMKYLFRGRPVCFFLFGVYMCVCMHISLPIQCLVWIWSRFLFSWTSSLAPFKND